MAELESSPLAVTRKSPTEARRNLDRTKREMDTERKA